MGYYIYTTWFTKWDLGLSKENNFVQKDYFKLSTFFIYKNKLLKMIKKNISNPKLLKEIYKYIVLMDEVLAGKYINSSELLTAGKKIFIQN